MTKVALGGAPSTVCLQFSLDNVKRLVSDGRSTNLLQRCDTDRSFSRLDVADLPPTVTHHASCYALCYTSFSSLSASSNSTSYLHVQPCICLHHLLPTQQQQWSNSPHVSRLNTATTTKPKYPKSSLTTSLLQKLRPTSGLQLALPIDASLPDPTLWLTPLNPLPAITINADNNSQQPNFSPLIQ